MGRCDTVSPAFSFRRRGGVLGGPRPLDTSEKAANSSGGSDEQPVPLTSPLNSRSLLLGSTGSRQSRDQIERFRPVGD